MSESDWLTVNEVSVIIRVDPKTLIRRINDQTIPKKYVRILGTDKRPQYRIHKSYLKVE